MPRLLSEDGDTFTLDPKCLGMIGVLKEMLPLSEDSLKIPHVKSSTMSKLVEWLEAHKHHPTHYIPPHLADRFSPQKDKYLQEEKEEECDFGDDDSMIEEDIGQATNFHQIGEDDHCFFVNEHVNFEQNLAAGLAMQPWDKKFFSGIDLNTLIELTKVTNLIEKQTLVNFFNFSSRLQTFWTFHCSWMGVVGQLQQK